MNPDRARQDDELTADGPGPADGASAPIPGRQRQLLPPSRYRHPGDVLRLIAAGLVLAACLVLAALARGRLLGPDAVTVDWLGSGLAGRILVGLVQVAFAAAAAGVLGAQLLRRRFRLLASLSGAAVAAGAAVTGILSLAGDAHPHSVAVSLGRTSWLASAAFPGPALLAGAAAVTVAASPWLSRPWRRTAWIMLSAAGVARLAAGTILPAELVLALAAGVTAGAGLLVALGVPDRRLGPDQISAALALAGLPVGSVTPAAAEAKGSRPFVATAADGRPLFIKALGSDQRDADLLYRAYRLVRLRDVGDTRPAASLIQAVEHQALVGMTAERAGVRVPRVERVVKAADGTALLVIELVDGSSLGALPERRVSDELLRRLWAEVDALHGARIAHRSLRSANVMVDSAAVAVIGPSGLAPAVPLLQPLALSAATRRATARRGGLLAAARSAAAAASGRSDQELARLQRVRPRTLLAIAAVAGAFYFLLPQLAQVGSSWRALQSANWAWLPVVIAASAGTYLASALSLMGGVPMRLRFWPTVLTQGASSFVNRVSPANVGGMALNARYLQKSGVDPVAGVAAVGVNSLAGAVVHLVLMVTFFIWAGRGLAGAFKLPSGGKLLLILAIVAALAGIALATRWGRRFATRTLLAGLRSSAASLRQVAVSPVKLTLLFGGSTLVTLAYIGGLAASIQAFGGGASFAEIGAVYLGAAAIAAAAPSPGGLGAIEAALVAGLTGIGLSPGAAVSAVLTYRLATYWLPVAPGWISWRYLQKRGYV